MLIKFCLKKNDRREKEKAGIGIWKQIYYVMRSVFFFVVGYIVFARRKYDDCTK